MEVNTAIKVWFKNHSKEITELSDKIWAYPEIGMDTPYACRETAAFMKKYGFEIRTLDGAMKGKEPNSLVAKWGTGKPVIGIMGEFDALGGMGQKNVPYYAPLEGAGHGCGHNLMAAGCAAAAIALKTSMEQENLSGTVIYFGCPAEETFEGKVHMIHDGLFKDVDVCLAWHPMPDMLHGPLETTTNACINMNIHYYGITSHAASLPHEGRSALDAAELTNVGVQYLREHVTSDIRMHSSYTSPAFAPNVIPDYASLNYFVRAENANNCEDVAKRVCDVAHGAAMMTGTTVKIERKAMAYNLLLNDTLNQAVYQSSLKVPEVEFSEDDLAYAKEIYTNVNGHEPLPEFNLLPTSPHRPTGNWKRDFGSTDVGDVSWIIPTVQYWGMGRVNGCPGGHHWSTTAIMAHSIGHKSMIYANTVLAQAAYDLLKSPEILEKAWDEFNEQRKKYGSYHCWLDDADKISG